MPNEYGPFLEALGADRLRTRTVLDAGANVGYSTRLFASRLPHAQVAALEPAPSNHAILWENTVDFHNVHALRAALWPRLAQLRLANGTRGKRRAMAQEFQYMTREPSIAATPEENSAPVYGVSVDALLEHLCVRSFDLIKLDIEGAERMVLGLQARERLPWLSRARWVILEVHEDMVAGSERRSVDALVQHNLSVVATFRARRPLERVYLGCSRRIGPEMCMAACVRWRNDSANRPAWCRLVRDGNGALQM